jgi:hypothetical protein
MSAEYEVGAVLVELNQDELAPIPRLQNGDVWTRVEAACRALWEMFGNSMPAPRYRIGVPQST